MPKRELDPSSTAADRAHEQPRNVQGFANTGYRVLPSLVVNNTIVEVADNLEDCGFCCGHWNGFAPSK